MRTQRTRAAVITGALVLFGAGPVHAQVVDTTKKGAAPDSTLLTPAMIDAGRKIFHGRGNCHACHGDKLQGGPIAPSLVGPTWRHITGSFDAIIKRVDEGLPGTVMVSHPGGISESQVYIVAAYIFAVSHSMAKP
jgi:mono/diheme cytochrome c family protein